MPRHLSSVQRLTSRARQHARVRRSRRLWVPEGLEGRVLLSGNPTYYTVNLTSDTGANSGTDAYPTAGTPSGDLLWAVTQANANTNPAGSVIEFDPTVFATMQTITLSSTLELSESAGPEVIDGPSAGVLISGNNAVEVFRVDSGVTAMLAGLTISGGSAPDGGGIYSYSDGTLTLSECTVSGNTAGLGAGIVSFGTLTLTGSTVEGNTGSYAGGIYSQSPTATISSSTIANNSSFGITIKDGGTLTVDDGSTVEGNTAAGILVQNATATITDTAITNNTAGGVNIGTDNPQQPASATITACTISGNSTIRNGGGIYNRGTLAVSDSTIAANSATGVGSGGGGIYNGGTLMLADSAIEGNSTSGEGSGGGISISNGGAATVTACTIAENSAGYGGGGAGVGNGGTLSIVDSNIAGNAVAPGSPSGGGGILNYGTTTVSDTTITDNSAGGGGDTYPSGGGGILNRGTFTVSDSTIAGNLAGAYSGGGGGIVNFATLTAVNTTIAYNDTGAPSAIGGGLYAYSGTTILYNTIVAANTADDGADDIVGAIASSSSNNLVGVDETGSVASSINPIVIGTANPGLGLLAYNGGPTQTIALLAGSPAIDAGSNALANDYSLTTDQRGPGFPRIVNGTVDIGAFERPTAASIRAATIYTVDLTSNNGSSTSALAGDLPYVIGQVNLNPNLAGSVIEFAATVFSASNPQTITLSSTLELGDPSGPLVIDGPGAGAVTISGANTVGVFQSRPGAVTTLSSLTISGGSVAREGGGIFVSGASTLTVSGCTITNNAAGSQGGGIDVANGGTLTLSECTVSGNTVGGDGGGIFSDGTLTLTDSTVEGNTAGGYADGIFSDGSATISGSTIADNSGTGVWIGDGGTLTLDDGSTVDGNAGGGIFLLSATATVTSTAITNSSGSGVSIAVHNPQQPASATITGCTISGNSSIRNGGGIDNGGALTLTDCTISGDSAGGIDGYYGGGIFNTGTVTVTGTTISSNLAAAGGGIWNQGALTLFNSTISGNSTEANGGGIFSEGPFTAVNTTIAYNDGGFNYFGGAGDGAGVYVYVDGATTILYNTIIAANTADDGPDDIGGAGVSSASAYNLVGVDETGSFTSGSNGNILVGLTNSGLGTLASNGGPTQTIALLPGSPAIGAGKNGINGFTLFTDQRGDVAPAWVWDIGAYQLNGIAPAAPAAALAAANVTPGDYGQTSYTFSITFASNAAIEASTLAGAVVQVVPPAGAGGAITTTAVSTAANGPTDPLGNAQSFTVTYQITPPGGSWSAADNGTYSITLGGAQVTDVDGTAISSGALGSFVVQGVSTATTLSASANPSVYGQPVTFIATVAANSSGSGTPAGTIQFEIDGSDFGGPVTLVNGAATGAAVSSLAVADHTIQAVYSGNSIFLASTGTLTQLVNKDSTTTGVVPSASTPSFGQSVTLAATITANAPGAGTPTGSVDFFDTTTGDDLGSVALSSGKASMSTASLPVGGNTIKVTYSGDGNFLTSSASTGTITIGQSIIVLDPTAGGALSLSGNASIKLTAGVFVDSSSSSAISASGNATVKASVIDVHGGVSKSGNASFSPAPVTGAAVLADPLASLAEPTTTGLTNYGSESLSGNSSATIKPGIYSQISDSGNGTLTMNSGLYIIEGGGFAISGNASVVGSGVTIFSAGSKYPATGGTYGSITLSGNGSYSLNPPTTGTYAGIVGFQSRDNAKAMTISGNASGMTGTIYAPAAQLAESGNAQLNAAAIVDTMTISGNGVSNSVALSSPAGTVAYAPAQIRSAYGISSLGLDGTGQTIAIVDAYDDPDIDQALDTFDSQFGLTASGPSLYDQYGPASSFLTVLNQYGQATSLPSTDPSGPGTDNWEVEEALDVEWAHAIAPGAQIILVEANSQSLSDLIAGVATAAAQPGVSVVSMSWGFAEGQAVFAADEAAYDDVFNVPGVTFVASTGDYGAADPEYPAYSPKVVAVGGTSLTLNGDGSYNSETGWGYESASLGTFIGSGGGISLYEPEPAYQRGVQSTGMRTTPDVSLVADPATGAWIADPYNLDSGNPFEVVGGTSLSAPAWAGLLALVNQGRAAAGQSSLNSTGPTDAQQALYMLPQSNYNVLAGGNNGYAAGAGYNLVTGLGTPVANLLVPDLVAYNGPGTSYSGSTVAPLLDASLVDTGSGPIDVFSVFNSIMVTHAGQSQKRPAAGIDSSTRRASAPAVQSTARTAISMFDGVLEVAADESLHEMLIGDLAFEQVSNGTRRRP